MFSSIHKPNEKLFKVVSCDYFPLKSSKFLQYTHKWQPPEDLCHASKVWQISHRGSAWKLIWVFNLPCIIWWTQYNREWWFNGLWEILFRGTKSIWPGLQRAARQLTVWNAPHYKSSHMHQPLEQHNSWEQAHALLHSSHGAMRHACPSETEPDRIHHVSRQIKTRHVTEKRLIRNVSRDYCQCSWAIWSHYILQ